MDNLPLTPDPGNEMYGRSGFLIHPGDRDKDPSEGCICLPKSVMDEIEESGDSDLVVYDSGPPFVLVGPGAVLPNPWRDPRGRPPRPGSGSHVPRFPSLASSRAPSPPSNAPFYSLSAPTPRRSKKEKNPETFHAPGSSCMIKWVNLGYPRLGNQGGQKENSVPRR
jgi:hypothetical protein